VTPFVSQTQTHEKMLTHTHTHTHTGARRTGLRFQVYQTYRGRDEEAQGKAQEHDAPGAACRRTPGPTCTRRGRPPSARSCRSSARTHRHACEDPRRARPHRTSAHPTAGAFQRRACKPHTRGRATDGMLPPRPATPPRRRARHSGPAPAPESTPRRRLPPGTSARARHGAPPPPHHSPVSMPGTAMRAAPAAYTCRGRARAAQAACAGAPERSAGGPTLKAAAPPRHAPSAIARRICIRWSMRKVKM